MEVAAREMADWRAIVRLNAEARENLASASIDRLSWKPSPERRMPLSAENGVVANREVRGKTRAKALCRDVREGAAARDSGRGNLARSNRPHAADGFDQLGLPVTRHAGRSLWLFAPT